MRVFNVPYLRPTDRDLHPFVMQHGVLFEVIARESANHAHAAVQRSMQ
jgi:hypothetical protein